MTAWIAYSGEKDPAHEAKRIPIGKAKARRKFEPWPCPSVEYASDKVVKRVADWCGISFFEALELKVARPYWFARVTGWTSVEIEATPLADEYAEEKRRHAAKDAGKKK